MLCHDVQLDKLVIRKKRKWHAARSAWLIAILLSATGHLNYSQAIGEQPIDDQLGAALQPDPAVEPLLRAVLVAKTPDDYRSAIANLKQEVGHDSQRLIPQLVLFELQEPRDSELPYLKYAVMKELDIHRAQIASALIPYLGGNEPALEQEINKWLQRIEHPDGNPISDFSVYVPIIEQHMRDGALAPRQLLVRMITNDPQGAIAAITDNPVIVSRAEARPVAFAQHEVADVIWKWKWDFLPKDEVHIEAREALVKLSHHQLWWVRFYVAEVMRQYPPFRNDKLIENLMVDEDEAVRSIVLGFVTATEKK